MGAYLSTPQKETKSEDFEEGDKYECGVSGMQGWRVNMEDAYNCFPDIGEDTGLFAVYDGHGGADVAIYCSHHFIDFLKKRSEYKEGNIETALKAAYMEIDEKLTQPSVIKELKVLSKKRPGDPYVTEEELKKVEEEEEEKKSENKECEDEAKLLYEEATMNIEDLLAKYGRTVSGVDEYASSECFGAAGPPSTAKKLKEQLEEPPKASDSNETPAKQSSDKESPPETACAGMPNPTAEKDSTQDKEKQGTASSSGDAPSVKKMVKTFLKVKPTKLEDDSDDDDDDDDYKGFESDEAVEGSSSEGDDLSDEEADNLKEMRDIELKEDDRRVSAEVETVSDEPGSNSGTTATIALLHDIDLFVANAGDSRCVLSRENGVALDMSEDHKPENKNELERITTAGGEVDVQGRVNGGLNLSRAIGDHFYKKNKDLSLERQMISAMPDVRNIRLKPGDEFLIIACDGIWNSMSSQQVVDFVRERLQPEKEEAESKNNETKKSTKLSTICEELFERCIAPDTMGDGTGCDNMTCMIVKFKQDWLQRRNSALNLKNQPDIIEATENPVEQTLELPSNDDSSKEKGDAMSKDAAKKSIDTHEEDAPGEGSVKQAIKRHHQESDDDNSCVSDKTTKKIKTN